MEEKLFAELEKLGFNKAETMDRFMDDTELYVTCLKRFMEEQTFQELKQKLDEQDFENAFNCAHSLKGVSANLGLNDLYGAVCNIVEPLRAKQYVDLNEKYDKIMEEKKKVEVVVELTTEE